jgi:hypothetical protein
VISRAPSRRALVALLAGAAVLVAALALALKPAAAPSRSGPSQEPVASGAAFVDSDRYPGGIPRQLDGLPVLLGLDAQLFVSQVPDPRRFLFGGWFDSRIVQACSGGIGPVDPNPLGERGCPRYTVEGAPGRLHFPAGLTLPQGDGPIVLEAHSRDPSAATCLPENRATCSEKVVVDAVRWFGDETTVAIPIGPNEARRRVMRLGIGEGRVQPDASIAYVAADLFDVAISCPRPWPTYVFRLHGDPRHGLIAISRDIESREAFEKAVDPTQALACLGTAFARAGPPRWVSLDNVSVLTFGDDAFVAAVGRAMTAAPNDEVAAVVLPVVPADHTEETLFDYLSARSAGLVSHAWGERLVDPVDENAPADPVSDPVADRYEGWIRDMLRRHAAGSLAGDVELLDVPLDAGRIGPEATAFLAQVRATDAKLYRVTHAGSGHPDLAVEEFVVYRIPDATFKDWMALRVTGAPYPPAP